MSPRIDAATLDTYKPTVGRDGLMLGEHVFFGLELFCAQAGLEIAAVRDVLEALRSSTGQAAV